MCGISGIVSFDPLSMKDIQSVRAMNRSLTHRGPDDEGEFLTDHIAFASRRLSIIGLDNGSQPISSGDGSLVLIANGEIYNHRDLRRDLESRGHHFRTESDCESILHCYAAYGLDCVDHLRGMFAFAIWDAKRKRLILGRDPMGEKPLLLFEIGRKLIFASEMKALLASGIVPFELDPPAINLYFHYQYVPEPRTAVRGVRKLAAAHLLVLDVDDWQMTDHRYWHMGDAQPRGGEPAAVLRDELSEVSGLITRADVPVGVALSGGIDSSAIAALAQRELGRDVRAFGVGYAGAPAGIDERKDARVLAQHLDIPFEDVEVRTDDVVSFFPELNFWRDDPIADYAGHGYYAVMKAARDRGVRVMMQGQGGDELFWGYPALRQAALETHRKNDLRSLSANAILQYFHPLNNPDARLAAANMTTGSITTGLSRLWRDCRTPSGQMVCYDITPDFSAAAETGHAIYTPSFRERLHYSNPTDVFTFPRPWPDIDVAMTGLVSDTYLCSNGVVQGDRLAMASSVELRLPFLDRRFVETVIGLRKHASDLHLAPKAWLKRAVSDLLPNEVMNRPKRGFEPPVREWHEKLFERHGESLVGGYLVQTRILTDEASKMFSAGEVTVGLSSPMCFKALVLEQWCRAMFACVPLTSTVALRQ